MMPEEMTVVSAVGCESVSPEPTMQEASPAETAGVSEELAALRAEADALRGELAAQRKLAGQLREFSALYPETAAEEIPGLVRFLWHIKVYCFWMRCRNSGKIPWI